MRYVILCLATLAGACGGGPTTPTPSPASVAGNWTGTITYTAINVTGGQRTVVAATATFTQTGSNFSGQLNTVLFDRTAATFSGTTGPNSIQGTMQFSNNAGCTGTASVSGTVVGGALRWNIPAVASTNCAWFTNVDVVLNR